jgi:hypothetical protein
MSDRFGVEIQIGGQLPVAKIQDLIDAINSEDLSLEWGDSKVSFRNENDLIEVFEGSQIILMDDERAWGDIDGLEETCRNLKLTFRTFVEPKYEYNGELRYYSPETGLIELSADVDGKPILLQEDLQEILSLLNLGRTDGAINKIRHYTKDYIVPRFEIIKG